ncbi:MAG: hypothetical protein P8176_12255 [Gammaproteobacteria bacterium]
MSKARQARESAEVIKQGILKLGRRRALALSPHQQWELTDELEQKADALVALLKSMESQK